MCVYIYVDVCLNGVDINGAISTQKYVTGKKLIMVNKEACRSNGIIKVKKCVMN